MKNIIYILFLFISVTVTAQNSTLFNKATDFYNAGEYQQAIDNYLEILQHKEHSATLYFNLGNAYYKLNKVAPSIYYYEKALLLTPGDKEITNNLAYAQNMTIDAIAAVPKSGISKIYGQVTGLLSFDQWAYASIAFMILFVLLYITFYYLRYAGQKRASFIAGIFALFASILCVVFAYLQYNDFTLNQPAIVFTEEVSIKSEPNKTSLEVFKLHEGSKVNVLDQLNGFKKISIIDGKTGWISAKDIKLLKDF